MDINNKIIICLPAVGVFRCFSMGCITGVCGYFVVILFKFYKACDASTILQFFKKNSISLYFFNIFVKKITEFIINFNIIRVNYNCILITTLFVPCLQAQTYASMYNITHPNISIAKCQ